jgi:hypothetical protein
LSNNLDTLIKLAENELRSKTGDWQKRQQSIVIAPTSEDYDLSTYVPGFSSVQSLTENTARGYYEGKRPRTFSQVSPAQIYSARANHPGQTLSVYAVESVHETVYLRLVADYSADNPGDLTLVYRGGVPDYEATDSSWMADEYGDLLLYTILKHCAVFVREEDRIELFASLAESAFIVADQDDKHNKAFGGSPLKMQPYHKVP